MGFISNKTRQWLLPGAALVGFVLCYLVLAQVPVQAATGINQQLNFQGRLLNSSGATAPDGIYNIEFKIYQDGDGQSVGDTTGSPSGSLKWTENHLVSGSAGVTLKNGYFSVQLGSVNAFGSSINWNQDTLWLSVDIGNTSSCTITTTFDTNCGGDGEMTPMKRLSSTPYALNAGQLGGLASSQYVQLAQGLQTDASNSTNSIYLNKTGAGGNFVDLQASGSDAFILGNAGDITFGSNANHTLSVATSGAGVAGRSLTITSGTAGSGGSALAGGNLILQGGNGGGTNGNGGNITIDAGIASGSGANGNVNIGNANASNINIATNNAAHTIAIGDGAAAQGITIGSTNSTSTLTLQSGSGGISLSGPTSVNGSNTFSTGTGNVALQGATTVSANFSVTNAANIAFQKGSDYSVTGSTNNVNFGTGAVIRLTGSSAQTITGIANGVDGRILTLINAASQSATLSNLNGGSSAANQISTGTGADLSVPSGASVSLVYDVGASLWRVVGSSSASGGYIQLQGSSPGTQQNGNFNISGIGILGTLDSVASGTLNVGTANAATINIGTNAAAHTIAVGNGAAVQGVTIGSTNSTSSLLLQAGTGNLSIQTQGGTLGIANNAVAQTVQIGSTTGAVSQTINIGNNGTASSTSTVVIGSTVAGTTTLQSVGGVTVTTLGAGGANSQVLCRDSSTKALTSCGSGAGNGSYIYNNTSAQTSANFNIQSAASTSIGGIIEGAVSQTAALFELQDSTGVNLQKFDASGNQETTGYYNNGVGGIGQYGNLLTFSEQLDNATWTAANVTVTANDAGSNPAPDGQTSAEKLVSSAAGGTVKQVCTTGCTTNNITYTFSVWVKANSTTQPFSLRIDWNNGGGQTGTAAAYTATTTWQRFSVSQAVSASGMVSVTPTIIVTNNTETIATWGAQLVQATNPEVYVRATTSQVIASSGVVSNGGLFISAVSATDKPLIVQSAPSQSGDLAELQNSSGVAITSFNSTGDLVLNHSNASVSTTSGNNLSIDTGGTNTLSLGFTNAMTINLGNTTAATQTLVQGGTGSSAVSVQAATSGTISLGTSNTNTINIGNVTGATGISEHVGTGNYTLDGVAGSTYALGASTTTGTITIGGTAQTGNIVLGSSTGTSNLNIANGSGATTVNIANVQNAGGVNIGAGMTTGIITIGGISAQTGTIAIGIGTGAQSLNFGTGGTAAKTVTVGSIASTSTTTIQGGTGGVNLGTGGVANTVQLGNTTGAVVQTINIGNNGTASSTSTVVIGSTVAGNITLQSAATIAIGNNAAAQTLNIGNVTGATAVTIQAGSGNLNLGTGNIANTIQIGSTTLNSGTQTINIGNNNTSGGTTNVTIGNSSSATGGTTTLQAKGNIVFSTNGTTRGTFDTSNDFYFGNGVSAAAPNNFTIQGTASTTTAVAGGSIIIQGGNATVGNANGGSITVAGGTGFGTGVMGSVVLATPTFQTAGAQNCSSNCNITQASIDGNGAVIVNATAASLTVTLSNPTITTAGKIVYVTAANGSNDFTLSVNGGGTGNLIAMRQNTTATMIWSGTAWTAAGASSSTTLQAAYNNTLTSAGGAELVVSNGTNANGLTIRDSSSNPVNGILLEVQNSSAAELFSVNDSVTEYASNGGAENTFGTEWAGINGATVTRNTNTTYIANGTGSVSIATSTTANSGARNTLSTTLTPNLTYNVSFAARLTIGSAAFTNLNVYYSVDGTTESVACSNYSTQAVNTSIWTKINCTFTAPTSGLTSSNAVFIQQTSGGTARTFYVDNFSVTVSGNINYATDGGVDNGASFSTNWTSVGGATVTRSTTVGNDTSDSAQVVTTGANQGVRNLLSINPFTSTLYLVTAYVASSTSGFNSFTVQYSRDGGSHFVSCVDYNTQTVSSSLTAFTEITCYITTDGTAATSPYVYFTQTDATGRTFYVDTFSMTLSNNTVPDVAIGGGAYGGPVTLLTLDRAASAPIAANNNALLGSMYYDTTLGKLQCYEASGWGACGSSPDNIITISPEYTNAVLHGTGVGTMTSDICSGALHINDGTSSQPTICGSAETYNFYKWTSPQATSQTYSIYVTYQLPDTFKTFSSGQTSLMGRTDSTNSTVQYTVYRNDTSTGLTQCGSTVAVSTGSVSSWQTGTATGAADPSTCGFVAGDSIVFKIDVIASQNANAYVGNLGFTFTNK